MQIVAPLFALIFFCQSWMNDVWLHAGLLLQHFPAPKHDFEQNKLLLVTLHTSQLACSYLRM